MVESVGLFESKQEQLLSTCGIHRNGTVQNGKIFCLTLYRLESIIINSKIVVIKQYKKNSTLKCIYLQLNVNKLEIAPTFVTFAKRLGNCLLKNLRQSELQ